VFGKEKKGAAVPRGLASVFEQLLRSPRHVAVVGGTGAGKTTFVKLLLDLAEHMGFRTVVIDWHGEYKSLPSLAYPLRVDAQLLPEVISHIVEEEAGTAGYSTYLALKKAQEAGIGSIEQLLRRLEELAEMRYSLRLGAQAAAARLEAVKHLVELANEAHIPKGSHRLNLGGVRYVQAKTLAALYVFQLYSYLKAGRSTQKTLVVLEESGNYSKPSKLLRELRHNGVKVIEILQYLPEDPAQANSIISNCNLVIGAAGAYSAQLVSKLHLNPEVTTLENGEFLILAGNKARRVRVF